MANTKNQKEWRYEPMNDYFSVEEINLMCIFNTGGRTALIAELRESLPGVHDPDMREIYESTITKLETISDDDFSDIGFYIADDYTEETEV
jgi:hypothetical protein